MEEIRERLIEAAGQEFAERGFRGTTIRHICHRAKANVASVNYYFGDKEQLYVETVKTARHQRSTAVPFPDWTSDTPAEQKLAGFIRTIISRMLGQPSLRWETQLMLREVLHPTDACRDLSEEYFRPIFEMLLSIISELAPGLSVERRRQIGFSVMGQCLVYRAAGEIVRRLTPEAELETHYAPAQIAAHVTEFSLAALRSETFAAAASVTDSVATSRESF